MNVHLFVCSRAARLIVFGSIFETVSILLVAIDNPSLDGHDVAQVLSAHAEESALRHFARVGECLDGRHASGRAVE
eukprot:scaffold20766_cov118-Isochrysis_galbana.AAC.1